jgi:isohexenylglutaconyl-CoA hydratase
MPMAALPTTRILRLGRQGLRLDATIDDPERRGAMSEALIADFEALLAAVEDDRDLRMLVLRGANGAFCAGADLKQATTDPAALNRRAGLLYARLNACPAVVVAAIDGPALGGGLGLACCADLVLGTPRARFAMPETRLGLPPAQIAPYVIARIGLAATRRLALTGMALDAGEAHRLGLIDLPVEGEEALDAALAALTAQIERCAPAALAATKKLLLECALAVPEDYADRAAALFAACFDGAEGREGMAAFLEKRPPDWAGQS